VIGILVLGAWSMVQYAQGAAVKVKPGVVPMRPSSVSVSAIAEGLRDTFWAIDMQTAARLKRVLASFKEHRLDESAFHGVNGYVRRRYMLRATCYVLRAACCVLRAAPHMCTHAPPTRVRCITHLDLS